MKDRKLRLEDAINATKAAVKKVSFLAVVPPAHLALRLILGNPTA